MQRKYLALAISIILCLGATLFLITPTTSQTIGQYDPWADINDDGRINILDAIKLGTSFGTAGNPTRNVNVTNWPTEPPYIIQSVTLNCTFTSLDIDSETGYYRYYGYSTTPVIYVGGYSRMWIHLIPPNPNVTSEYAIGDYGVDQYAVSIDWIDDPSSYHSAHEFPIIQSITEVNVSTLRSPPMYAHSTSILGNPIATKSPYLRLTIYSYIAYAPWNEPGWMNMTVKIYLRNE